MINEPQMFGSDSNFKHQTSQHNIYMQALSKIKFKLHAILVTYHQVLYFQKF